MTLIVLINARISPLLFQGYVALKLTISISWNVCKNKKTSNNKIGCFHFMPLGLVQFDNTNKTLFLKGESWHGCDIISYYRVTY